jgi:exonuclease SbcC
VDKAQSWLREYDAPAGSWKDLSRSHQEIGEEITQLLGMSREQFCQVVLLPQGDFARFLRADAEARGKLLGRLFDTHRFAAVEKRLAERRRAAETQVRAGTRSCWPTRTACSRRPVTPWSCRCPTCHRATRVSPSPYWSGRRSPAARHARGSRSPTARRRPPSRPRPPPNRVLEDVREVARLQRRFAEARERADGWRSGPGPIGRRRRAWSGPARPRRWRPRWSCGRPPETEHRRAAGTEARARALLPETFADAGAAGLAAAARRAAEELGGLESARRAEHRIAELADERAGLDRQERADEDVLHDAETWLAEWDSTRADLQTRIEAAQEATTRAEQLAVQREPAEAAARAARQRDQLAGDTDEAQRACSPRGSAPRTRAPTGWTSRNSA